MGSECLSLADGHFPVSDPRRALNQGQEAPHVAAQSVTLRDLRELHKVMAELEATRPLFQERLQALLRGLEGAPLRQSTGEHGCREVEHACVIVCQCVRNENIVILETQTSNASYPSRNNEGVRRSRIPDRHTPLGYCALKPTPELLTAVTRLIPDQPW